MATWDDAARAAWNPEFDVRETDGAYIVVGDVPGLAADDLEVTITGRRLRIAGTRDQARRDAGSYERASGRFARAFELPDPIDADGIRCALDDGVLEVTLPKRAGGWQSIDVATTGGEARAPFETRPPFEPVEPSEMPAPKLA